MVESTRQSPWSGDGVLAPDRAQDALLQALAGIRTGIAVFDAGARLQVATPRYAELFAADAALLAPGTLYRDILAHHAAAVLDPLEASRIEALAARPAPADAPLAAPQLFQSRAGGWLELEERVGQDGSLICLWTDVTRRLTAETEVIRLQGRLRDAIQSLPDGFALFDADDRLDLHNTAFLDRYGLEPDLSLVGVPYPDLLRRALSRGLVDPGFADEEARESWVRLTTAAHRNPQGPSEVQLSDGRWIRVSETRTEDGGVVGIHSDITALKQREAELARRTAMLDAVTQAATRIIGHGDWQDGTEELLRRLGRALEVTHAALFQVHTVSDDGVMQACLAEWSADPAAAGDPSRLVARLGEADGVGLLRDGFPVHGPAGRLAVPILVDEVWWGHIAFDGDAGRHWSPREVEVLKTAAALLAGAIQRARLDAELRKSEARKQAIVESALDCVVTIDASGLLVEFNPAAEATFGWQRGEAVGQRMEDLLIPPDLRAGHQNGFARFLAGDGGGMVGRRVEVTAMRRDGTTFPAEMSIAPARVGDELFFTAYLRDITDRRDAERALMEAKTRAEAAAEAKSAFLGNMSHELRTPLNAIIGFSEILKDQLLGPLGEPKYAEFAADIHEGGAHLLGIINDVLDMARIEAGEHHLMRETIDLGTVVRSCLQMLRDRAAKGEVALIDDTGPLPVGLYADRRAVMKILLNLLSNAVKFTPPGGRARVTVGPDETGAVVLRVEDTGVGIPSDALSRVFEPFQQADMNLNRQHEGAGLGLTITRALVELHGGSIALASTQGHGTTVTVRFPPA
ncbi:PAS-domain containing protein [Azospirillum soli]|uniref:PAS-domain containing protein n=1 Tax=Azospirillum soli TaxID=1304799 RepID=UPI001AE2DA69|nr:PAS-domain containing protein [Azospirillum soli]MBP2313613.1 PAS domain S-box-containing protein [Azospirillum soli]